jgi:adenylylsulfate reductase subunit B
MPARTDDRLCDGCRGAPEPACVEVCPGDLMALDPQTLKGFCRDYAGCWDCCACVKACPAGAVTPRLDYALALYGSKVVYEGRTDGGCWTFSGEGGEETFGLPGDGGWRK